MCSRPRAILCSSEEVIVAFGFLFSPRSMNVKQYDECIKKLEAAGAGRPPGRLYHACFGSGDKLRVFDIWDSQESFNRFGQTLMPILNDMALDPGQPEVAEIHNVIRG